MAERVKITVTYDLEVDGPMPSEADLVGAGWEMASDSQYIGSESIDGTDKWGLEVKETSVSVSR